MENQTRGTLRDVLYTLFRYQWLFLGVFVLVAGAGIVYTKLSPRVYEASSKIYLTMNYERIRLTQSEVNTRLNVEQLVATEIEVLKSWTLLDKALEMMEEAGLGDPAIDRNSVMASFRIQPVRNTTFIEVRFRHTSPAFARDMVNHLIRAYEEFRQVNRSRDNQVETYADMIENIDLRIVEAEEELTSFNEVRDISSLDAQQDQELDQIGRMRTSLLQKDLDYATQLTRLEAMRRVQQDFSPARIQPEVLERNSQLNAMLQTFNTRYQERLVRSAQLTPDNPEMLMLDDNLAQLEEELERLYDASVDAQVQYLETLDAERELIRAQMRQSSDRKRELSRAGSQQSILQKKLQDLQNVRTVINQKLEESRIRSIGADRLQIQQIAPALLPNNPVKPKVLFNYMASLVLALVLAGSLPFYLQAMDSRINTDTDLYRTTGLPTLSVVRLKK